MDELNHDFQALALEGRSMGEVSSFVFMEKGFVHVCVLNYTYWRQEWERGMGSGDDHRSDSTLGPCGHSYRVGMLLLQPQPPPKKLFSARRSVFDLIIYMHLSVFLCSKLPVICHCSSS